MLISESGEVEIELKKKRKKRHGVLATQSRERKSDAWPLEGSRGDDGAVILFSERCFCVKMTENGLKEDLGNVSICGSAQTQSSIRDGRLGQSRRCDGGWRTCQQNIIWSKHGYRENIESERMSLCYKQ
jgi:hypothetical protein